MLCWALSGTGTHSSVISKLAAAGTCTRMTVSLKTFFPSNTPKVILGDKCFPACGRAETAAPICAGWLLH